MQEGPVSVVEQRLSALLAESVPPHWSVLLAESGPVFEARRPVGPPAPRSPPALWR